MRTTACFERGDGMDPVHCNLVHFHVETLNDQVSLKADFVPPKPPNLQNIINEGRRREYGGYEHDDLVGGGH